MRLNYSYVISYLVLLLSVLFYFYCAYIVQRHEQVMLLSLYLGVCFLSIIILHCGTFSFKHLTVISIVFRLIFLFALPNLSQDFYRFIWDGRLILEGYNPFLYTPKQFIETGVLPISQASDLYYCMGELSGKHFSNYPPLSQFCFMLVGLFANKSILGSAIVFRLVIILADLGTLYFGKSLLERLQLPKKRIFWYLLNPLVIIELAGNLHFEGIMVFFIVWSLYLLHQKKWLSAAVIFALSISVKLVPIILLPLFFQKLKPRGITQIIVFYSIVIGVVILTFLPFLSTSFLANYTNTIALWFTHFEFNASLYFIARKIGYWLTGYNQIAVIGKLVSVVVIGIILFITFFRKNRTTVNIITAMLLVLSMYFFLSTTVHPWYIVTHIALSIYTKYKFILVWSVVVILSYWGYSLTEYTLETWSLVIEYSLVYSVFIWEVFLQKKFPHIIKNPL